MTDLEVAGQRAAVGPVAIQRVEGDSLHMAARVRRILRERALIWDAHSLVRRSLAVLAHHQLGQGRVRRSEGLVTEAVEEAFEELFEGDQDAAGFEVIGLGQACSGVALMAACRAHNRQPLEARRAFQGLVLDGRGLDEVAQDLGWDGGAVARAARSVLVKFFEETVTPKGGQVGLACVARAELLQMEVLR